VRVLVTCLLLVAASSPARAQQASDGFGIERFRLAMDRDALLDVEWAGVPEHGSWGASAWVGYAHDPLVVYRDATRIEPLVAQRLATGVVGSIALWDRLELGVGLDLVGYQTGSQALMELPAGGLGDLRAIAKVALYRDRRFAFALVPAVSVPGGGADGYLREAGPTATGALAASVRDRRWRASLNIGYLARERTVTAGLVVDDEVFVRLAAAVTIGRVGEVSASWSIASPTSSPAKNQVADEAMAGVQLAVAPTLAVFAAGGLGLDNGFGTPDFRAVAGLRLSSAPPLPIRPVIAKPTRPSIASPTVDADSDHDGIADSADRCPRAAEDRDGFEDDDGCPDPPARLDGRTIDPEGLPVGHVQIRIGYTDHPELPVIETTSDVDGVFHVDSHGGALQITATVAEYQPLSTTVTAAAGANNALELRLVRKVRQGQLRGQVLSFGGQPLAATITINAGDKQVATTTAEADGLFRVELPAGTFEVVIEAPGHVTQRRTVKVKLDAVFVLNIDLRAVK